MFRCSTLYAASELNSGAATEPPYTLTPDGSSMRDDDQHLGVLGRQVADERRHVLARRVAVTADDRLLRRAGLARHLVAGDGRLGPGALLDHAGQDPGHRRGGLSRDGWAVGHDHLERSVAADTSCRKCGVTSLPSLAIAPSARASWSASLRRPARTARCRSWMSSMHPPAACQPLASPGKSTPVFSSSPNLPKYSGQPLLAQRLAELHRADVARVSDDLRERPVYRAARVRLMDDPVADPDGRREVEHRVRGEEVLVDDRRGRHRLHGRTGLVGVDDRPVADLGGRRVS